MKIEFVDKNACTVVIRVNSGKEADIVMALLSKIPDSEFIRRPTFSSGV